MTTNENKCVANPTVQTDDLWDIIETEDSPLEHHHMKSCQFCQERVEQLLDFDSLLSSKLERFGCYGAEKLMNFKMERLNASDQQNITRHLETCIVCRNELTTLEAFLGADDNVGRDETMRVSIPETHFHLATRLHVEAGALRGMRGKLSKKVWVTVDEEITIALEFRKRVPVDTLNGELIAEEDVLEKWDGATVLVHHVKGLQARTRVDDLGYFQCEIAETEDIWIQILAEDGNGILISGNTLDN